MGDQVQGTAGKAYTAIVGEQQLKDLVTSTDKLVVIDFWAEWCGPCRMLGPVLEDMARQYADKMILVKIDVDEPENQALAMAFRVSSIPQVTFFKNGALVDQFIGVLPRPHIEAFLQKYMTATPQ